MAEESNARWSWKRLVWLGPVGMGLVFLLVMVILAGGFEPFLFVFGLITLIVGYVGRRFPRRAGPITVLVVMTLLILMNSASIVDDLGHPESFVNFAIFGVLLLVLALTGLVASIAVLMSRSGAGAARFANVAIGLIVLSIVVSAIATLSFDSDALAAGDVQVVAEDVEFAPATISGSGTVGVFVDNKDPIRHTFTIDALDIDLNLPGGSSRRVDITAAPGTYEFQCEIPGHDDMKGTLTISG